MITDINTYIFDLDKTIWNCQDIFGNSIWAKQLIEPYTKLNDHLIMDDCGSLCVLDKGIREYIHFLHQNNKEIAILSIGGRYDAKWSNQPSVNLLDMFDLLDHVHFGHIRYKTENKCDLFDPGEKSYYFNDNEKENEEITEKCPNVKVVDRLSFKNWFELFNE